MNEDETRQQFLSQLNRPWMADELFDAIPDSVYFVKDREGKYVAVNQTLVERCGRKTKAELIGLTASELFPPPLGESFTEQDLEIIRSGHPIRAQLELHLYTSVRQGWCLTWKEPILNDQKEVVGLSGISRDLPSRADLSEEMEAVSKVLHHIDRHLDQSLVTKDLAALVDLSTYQLDQRIRTLFGVTIGQYITRRRIDHACHLLERSTESLSVIALDCGYSDQSAFTRQFRQSVGLPPGSYRDSKRTTS